MTAGRPPRAAGPWRRFARSDTGVSAVEFALVLPMLLLLYIGLAAVGGALTADRKADKLASSIGDLVSRVSTLTTAQLNSLFGIRDPLLAPFDDAGVQILVADVKFVANGNNPNGTPRFRAAVRWAHALNTTAPACNAASPVTIPTGLMPTTTAAAAVDVVVTRVVYPYQSPFAGMLGSVLGDGSWNFEHAFILRPRMSNQVTNTSAAAC